MQLEDVVRALALDEGTKLLTRLDRSRALATGQRCLRHKSFARNDRKQRH